MTSRLRSRIQRLERLMPAVFEMTPQLQASIDLLRTQIAERFGALTTVEEVLRHIGCLAPESEAQP